MITYYDDGSVQVTSERIHIDSRSYPLTAFAAIWHRRGPRSWRALAGRGALLAAITGPVLTAALGIVIAMRMDLSVTVTIGMVGICLLIGLAVGPVADMLLELVDRSYLRGDRQLEIWARCDGERVLLLRTRDAQRFGQIYRALQRAVEQQDPPGRRRPRSQSWSG
jgi:hypothetical protein